MDDGYRNALMPQVGGESSESFGYEGIRNALMQPLRDQALNGPGRSQMLNQLLLAAGFLGGGRPMPANPTATIPQGAAGMRGAAPNQPLEYLPSPANRNAVRWGPDGEVASQNGFMDTRRPGMSSSIDARNPNGRTVIPNERRLAEMQRILEQSSNSNTPLY